MTTLYTTGASRSPLDTRDWAVGAYLPAAAIAVPPELDLRPCLQPIRDQGQLGSCTAFSVCAGTMGYEEVVSGEPTRILSPLHAYLQARALDGQPERGDGSHLRSVLEVGRTQGYVLESDRPYNVSAYPPLGKDGPAHAAMNMVPGYAAVDTRNIEQMIQSLLAHGPLSIALDCLDGFMSPGPGAVVTATGASHGGHAVTIAGFSIARKVWLVRNSWGTGYGQSGYCWVPWSYALWEAWAILDAKVIKDGTHPSNFPWLVYLVNALNLHIPGIN
jgi:C1A family cysteine protease